MKQNLAIYKRLGLDLVVFMVYIYKYKILECSKLLRIQRKKHKTFLLIILQKYLKLLRFIDIIRIDNKTKTKEQEIEILATLAPAKAEVWC